MPTSFAAVVLPAVPEPAARPPVDLAAPTAVEPAPLADALAAADAEPEVPPGAPDRWALLSGAPTIVDESTELFAGLPEADATKVTPAAETTTAVVAAINFIRIMERAYCKES